MAQGESAITFVTKNVHLRVTSSLVADTANSVLPIPAGLDEIQYGALPTTLTLGPKGLTGCPDIGDYAQTSVLLWMTIPFADSSVCQTPMMTISSVKQSSGLIKGSLGSFSDKRDEQRSSLSLKSSTRNMYNTYGTPAYTLTIQFPQKEDFNFSAGVNYTTTKGSRVNFTMPACTKYNGFTFEPCKGCNVSSYTNYNVTYSCYDVRQICPVTTGPTYGKRKFNSNNYINENENKNEIENARKKIAYDDLKRKKKNEEEEWTTLYRLYRLKDYFYKPEPPLSDRTDYYWRPELSKPYWLKENLKEVDITPTANSYSVLTDSIQAKIVSVLTNNPSKINLESAKIVLGFVGSFTGFIFIMFIYLLRRDNTEKIQRTYVKTENEKLARKLLEEDIKNGKRGDHGAIYQDHLSACKSAMIKNTGIVSSIQRTSVYNLKNMFFRKRTRKDGAVYPSNYKKQKWRNTVIFMESIEDEDNFSYDNRENRNSLRMSQLSSKYPTRMSTLNNKYPNRKRFNSENDYDNTDTNKPYNDDNKNNDNNNLNNNNNNNSNNNNNNNDDNNYDDIDDDDYDEINKYYNNNNHTSDRSSYRAGSVVIEFMQRLFPGHAIYKNKTNALYVIALNHDYFKMFAGSTMTRCRTIRFLDLVILVLVTIFVDTVFFSVFFPRNACESNNSQVISIYLSVYCLL